jgi:hypothetical protein
MLADEGRAMLDFTPGDDPWKERFSTGRREIFELVMHSNLQRASAARARKAAKDFAKQVLARIGLSKQFVATRLRAGSRAARNAVAVGQMTAREQFYRLDLSAIAPEPDARVSRDDLDALLRWGASLSGQRRQPFLQGALQRIESGDRCYSLRTANGLAALAWLALRPDEGAAQPRHMLADFAVAPASPGEQAASLRAVIASALGDAKDRGETAVFASISPRDGIVREALTAAGFCPAP